MSKNVIDAINAILKKEYKIKPVITQEKNTITVQVSPPFDSSPKRLEIGNKLMQVLPSNIKVAKIQQLKNAKYFSVTTAANETRKIEIKQFKEGESRQTPFAPSQVQLGGKKIVNTWLTIDEMINIVSRYVATLKIPDADKKAIKGMVQDCAGTGYGIRYTGNKKLVPAEFFEVLSSIKLGSLVKSKDSKICSILGIPSRINVSTVHIFIPEASNYPLTDYEISINGAHTQSKEKSKRSTLKISVKSKVSSPKTNTVKFTDVFDSGQDVKDWMKRYKQNQKVQGEIAHAGVSYPSGKKSYYPVHAMGKIVDDLNAGLSAPTRSALKKLSEQVYTIKNPKEIFIHTHHGITANEDKALREFVTTYVGAKTGTKKVSYTTQNILVACEKFLEKESRKQNNNPKLNFYQMFYDKILQEKKIAYSIAKRSGDSIFFNYYSLVNWKTEYSDWVALRGKNSADQVKDTLGLDV
jgi:hypothetical protein